MAIRLKITIFPFSVYITLAEGVPCGILCWWYRSKTTLIPLPGKRLLFIRLETKPRCDVWTDRGTELLKQNHTLHTMHVEA